MKETAEHNIPELIRSGKDKEAVSLLYRKVLPLVKNYISKNNGNIQDAYDVFHDALILFYEQVISREFDDKYKVYGYLYRISIFRWLNKIKKDKALQFPEEFPEEIMTYWMQFDEPKTEKEETLLKSLFSSLGDKCVELLSYTIYSDLLMEDIAERMNFVSVDAVRMKHMRCKQKLMEEIEKNPSILKKLRKE